MGITIRLRSAIRALPQSGDVRALKLNGTHLEERRVGGGREVAQVYSGASETFFRRVAGCGLHD